MNNKNKFLPYLLPLRCIIFLVVFIVGAFATGRKVDEISNWWSGVTSIVNIATILLLIFITKKQKSRYRELINYEKGKTSVKQIIAVSAVVVIVGMAGMYIA